MPIRQLDARARPGALVFDMDGLLLDTERVALDTFVCACRSHGWIEPALDVYYRCIGTLGRHSEEILRDGYGPDFPLEAVSKTWSELYLGHVENRPVDVKTGASDLLAYCAKVDIPCALATSTSGPLAATKLSLAGLDGYFSAMVTGDMVRRGKPDPEPYRTAAERLRVAPEKCWALEDSANGVRSAIAAGFEVIQIPDLVAPSDEIRRLGHTVLGSLQDVLVELKKVTRDAD